MFTLTSILHQTRIRTIAVALLAVTFLITSCKDDDDDNKPTITSIGTGTAYVGDTVTIVGEKFTTEKTKVTVNFGTATANVLNATNTTLEVIVPDVDGAVDVTVTVNGKASDGFSFSVNVNPIKISGFSPKTIMYDSILTITGENFRTGVEVYVNGKPQTEDLTVSDDGKTITVKMAAKTYSGQVKVVQKGLEKVFEDKLKYKLTFELADFNNKKGGDNILLFDDGSYYLTSNGGMYKMNSDHTIAETILESSFSPYPNSMFLAENDTIYITNDRGGILKVKNGATDVETLFDNLDGAWDITGDYDGNIYFSDDGADKIFNYNLKSRDNPETIITFSGGESPYGLVMVEDTIFISTTYQIIKMNIDGSGKKIIVPKDSGYNFSYSDICVHPSGNIIAMTSHTSGGIYNIDAELNVTKLKFNDEDLLVDGGVLKEDGNLLIASSFEGELYELIIK